MISRLNPTKKSKRVPFRLCLAFSFDRSVPLLIQCHSEANEAQRGNRVGAETEHPWMSSHDLNAKALDRVRFAVVHKRYDLT